MGVVNLKTNLKSLKYGNDEQGGGNSGQPYIQVDINNPTQLVRKDDDGMIRGGSSGAANASDTDSIRIGKFFIGGTKGKLFLQKQVGLQFTNPKIETLKGKSSVNATILGDTTLVGDALRGVSKIIGGIGNTLSENFGPTRIYNLGINTLSQIGGTAFGKHYNRHGLLPIQSEETKYEYVVTKNNINHQNRLESLYNKFSLADTYDGDEKLKNWRTGTKANSSNSFEKTIEDITNIASDVGAILGGKTGRLISRASNLLSFFKTSEEREIDNYLGGPGSTYGIGKTIIRRYSNTEDADKIKLSLTKSQEKYSGIEINYFNTTGVSRQYIVDVLDKEGEISTTSPFRKPSSHWSNAINYSGNNPKTKSQSVSAYSSIREGVKALKESNNPLYKESPINKYTGQFAYFGGDKLSKTNENKGLKKEYDNTSLFARKDKDILTICFGIVDPFDKKSLQKPDRIWFSSYLKGYKENYGGTWNEVNYAGRSESMYIYNKFKRDVSFNLQIPINNREELYKKYRGLGQLASTTAGTYNSNGLLAGILIELNVGKHLVKEYGILNSISYSIPDNAPWDTGVKNGDNDILLSMLLEVSFNFTIIGKNLPKYKQGEGFFKDVKDDKVWKIPDL